MDGWTHLDEQGRAVMVDVSAKPETARTAAAAGRIRVSRETFRAIRDGTAAKGDVLAVARVAGIMAAKRTGEWIPLCHPLGLEQCAVEFHLDEARREVEAVCTASLHGRTGVEMEALTGVSAALLTVYDMCKAMDRGMEIVNIRLLEKSGGRSGTWHRGVDGPSTGGRGGETDAPSVGEPDADTGTPPHEDSTP